MKILEIVNERINQVQTDLTRLENMRSFLRQKSIDVLNTLPEGYVYGGTLDFDNLSHDKVMEVIKTFPGRWKKEPGDDAKIHYSTEINGVKIRCWSGEPPPNCRVIEEYVTVPAREAQTIKKRRLVCSETVDTTSV